MRGMDFRGNACGDLIKWMFKMNNIWDNKSPVEWCRFVMASQK